MCREGVEEETGLQLVVEQHVEGAVVPVSSVAWAVELVAVGWASSVALEPFDIGDLGIGD